MLVNICSKIPCDFICTCLFSTTYCMCLSICRFCSIHRDRDLLSDPANTRSSVAGKGGLLGILRWRHLVSWILVHIPHSVLSFRENWPFLQQVRIFRKCMINRENHNLSIPHNAPSPPGAPDYISIPGRSTC